MVDASDRQHATPIDLIMVGGALTTLGLGFVIGLVLASRISTIEAGKFKITFDKGVPQEVVKIIEVAGKSLKLDELIKLLGIGDLAERKSLANET